MAIAPSVLDRYTDDIAFAAGEQPATTTEDFIHQLHTAASNLADAGINGTEDLETAATLINEALAAPAAEQRTLINRATQLLKITREMVDEYRDMV